MTIILTSSNKRQYSKASIILAAELLCVSPAAYRMITASRVICLPKEKCIRDLMSRSLKEENVRLVMQDLQPKQRLVNVLFDEVKLKSALRFLVGHILAQALNSSNQLASSALPFQIVCHHDGPRFVIRVLPVANLNAKQMKDYILEVLECIIR